MAYLVTSPGSCGEFIQGYAEGTSFMVTCPINRYSYAISDFAGEGDFLPQKAKEAVIHTLKYIHHENDDVSIKLKSHIPWGKGMASSTADISAVCQATALNFGVKLSNREIAKIALSIEPSDATFFKGIVEFDYRHGKVIREMGDAPDMQILVYDCGGEIDTMAFNSRNDLPELQKKNEADIIKAMELFKEGMKKKSLNLIGQASTISAFANQKILYKKELEGFYEAGMHAGGKGIICAHSGTVLGLILPVVISPTKAREVINCYHLNLKYLDTVRLTNEGMHVTERENL